MGLQLKYTSVTLPDGVGETFYAEDGGLAKGSLWLVDFSNPACLNQSAANTGGAVNLAADQLVANAGAGAALDWPASASEANFALTAGKGLYKPVSGSPITAISPAPSTAFKSWLRANQPDVLTTTWLRYNPSAFTAVQDNTFWGPVVKTPAFWRIGMDARGIFVRESVFIPNTLVSSDNSYLVQIATSRTEIFVNGQKAADFNATGIGKYDQFLNGLDGSITDYFWILRGAGLGDGEDGVKFYRFVMEDFAASGRSALEAVQAEYEYVMNNSSFVHTV